MCIWSLSSCDWRYSLLPCTQKENKTQCSVLTLPNTVTREHYAQNIQHWGCWNHYFFVCKKHNNIASDLQSLWFHVILHVQKLNPDMCCIRVYHDNALLRPIQICTVWTLYIHLYSFYFFLYGFLKMQPGAVSTACAPFVATSKTAVIANCPDFKQMHNIRTTIKLGAIEPVSQRPRVSPPSLLLSLDWLTRINKDLQTKH